LLIFSTSNNGVEVVSSPHVETELLQVAAALGSLSEHPIGEAWA
jgi:cation transport ATPase